MFDNLFGNIQQQQEELQRELAQIFVEAEAGDGAVVVRAGADMHIENLRIDREKADLSDPEQLEDLILVALNRALEQARQRAAEETQKRLKGMLPGGFDQFLKP